MAAKKVKRICSSCGLEFAESDFPASKNRLFKALNGRLPICKSCMNDLYDYYYKLYSEQAVLDGIDLVTNFMYVEKKAVERVCMYFDIYYSSGIFDSAINSNRPGSVIQSYLRMTNLAQHSGKSYDNTINEERIRLNGQNAIMIEDGAEDKIKEEVAVSAETAKFFGLGFKPEDYLYLKTQYDDWITRHECNNKAQEEVFKQICFVQLELFKANRDGADTKDLYATFQKLLDMGKLQPKQNYSETLSDVQTFGTLIEKWETTRPLPEIDEELRDVDKIGLYINVFFKGHLAKMMNIKNAFSNLYTKFMEKYTVKKPEYAEEDSEALFDAIFGEQIDKIE